MRTATILATAGLLTAAMAATAAEVAASKAPLRQVMESQPVLHVADRPRVPGTTRPSGGPGGPGMGIVIPFLSPGLSEIPINKERPGPKVNKPKAKIPAPVHCVAPTNVGKAEVIPMSALPPPQICPGKQQEALVNVVGSQTGNKAGVVKTYCIFCEHGFSVWKVKSHPIALSYLKGEGSGKGTQSLILKGLQCYQCKSNYVWNAAKHKCCKNPNK